MTRTGWHHDTLGGHFEDLTDAYRMLLEEYRDAEDDLTPEQFAALKAIGLAHLDWMRASVAAGRY